MKHMREHTPSPSIVQEQVLRADGHRYTVGIPHRYTGNRPVPLVLALHYGGTVTPFYGKGMLVGLVEPALRELGALIVAPDCPDSNWTDPRTEAAVLRLIDHIQDSYAIAPQTTLIMGYSMGGQGTWFLSARHQDRFTAALIMAGLPPADILDVEWEIPLYVIHSRQDDVMPWESTEVVAKQLQAKGVSVEFVVLDGIGHYETNRFVEPLRAAVPWIERVWS